MQKVQQTKRKRDKKPLKVNRPACFLSYQDLAVAVQLGTQQCAQAGQASAFTRGLLVQRGHGFLLVSVVLGFD